MNKFAEIVKTNKSKIVKGAVVIGGSVAGLVIGLGVIDDLRNSPDVPDVDGDAIDLDLDSSDPITETD